MWLLFAHEMSFCPSAMLKTGPVSFRPIIGVTPSMRARAPAVFSGQICAICPSTDWAAAITASPHSFDEPKSIVIGLTMPTSTPLALALFSTSVPSDGVSPKSSLCTSSV